MILKVIAESSSRVAMLKEGVIDVATGLAPTELAYLEGVPGIRVINIIGNQDLIGIMQNQMPPFDDVHVRRAINFAIPQDDIVKTAWFGYGKPWRAGIPAMYPGGLTDEEFPYHYNLDKAREELAKSAYPEGFEEEFLYDATSLAEESTAVLIKDSLAKIGIDIKLRKMTPAGITDLYMAREMKFGFLRNKPIFAHPAYSVSLYYESISICDYQDYRNPEIDQRIRDAATILDFDESVRVHHEIIKDIVEEAPTFQTVELNYALAMRDNIKGWSWTTIDTPDFSLVYTE